MEFIERNQSIWLKTNKYLIGLSKINLDGVCQIYFGNATNTGNGIFNCNK